MLAILATRASKSEGLVRVWEKCGALSRPKYSNWLRAGADAVNTMFWFSHLRYLWWSKLLIFYVRWPKWFPHTEPRVEVSDGNCSEVCDRLGVVQAERPKHRMVIGQASWTNDCPTGPYRPYSRAVSIPVGPLWLSRRSWQHVLCAALAALPQLTPRFCLLFRGVRRLLQPLPVSLQPSPVLRDVRMLPYHFSALQATSTAPPSPTEIILPYHRLPTPKQARHEERCGSRWRNWSSRALSCLQAFRPMTNEQPVGDKVE